MDDEKLRLITPTKQVLKSGVERKRSAQQEGKLPSGVGFWDLTRADIEQNNVLSKLWSRNKLAILSSAPAPAGWNARNEIKGLFRDYEDFLSKAKNPYELDYRKKLVLGKINYQRMLAKSGFLKGSSASMLACLMDPLTYVSFGLAGKLGANAVRTGALALGAGRVTTAAVHGAALTAGANLIETPVLRAIGASPDNPEYHVISAALGGALFGGFSGWIGKSLAYSRFRIEQGTGPRASSNMGFKIFEKADLAKCKAAGVTAVFVPKVDDMYAKSHSVFVDEKELGKTLSSFRGEPQRLELPSAPKVPIDVRPEPNRPMAVYDSFAGGPGRARGMATSIGRLRESHGYYKAFALSHNTLRGGAGGSVLNAEYAYRKGIL